MMRAAGVKREEAQQFLRLKCLQTRQRVLVVQAVELTKEIDPQAVHVGGRLLCLDMRQCIYMGVDAENHARNGAVSILIF